MIHSELLIIWEYISYSMAILTKRKKTSWKYDDCDNYNISTSEGSCSLESEPSAEATTVLPALLNQGFSALPVT